MKKLAGFLFAFFGLLVFVQTAFADGVQNCQAIYGGGQVCPPQVSFNIHKQVQNPTQGLPAGRQGGQFVDNLSINDPHYLPSQTVPFQVTITNTGNSTLKNVNVVDTFPQFISYFSGSGNFDSNKNTLSFKLDSLDVGKSQTFSIVGKTSDAKFLPSNQNTVCVINQAQATDQNGVAQNSSSQVCIEIQAPPKVFENIPMKQTPPTGPEDLPLLALIPTAAAGIFLRIKSMKVFGKSK
jgi:uncharacterized repeat protein (TIGR01451 family)